MKTIFDCNIFVQALINPAGPAGACVQLALDGQITLFVADFVIAELRGIPQKPISAKLGITPKLVEDLVQLLLVKADYVSKVPTVFAHPIDEDDSAYVDLAARTQANVIVSRDRHLLGLMDSAKAWAADFRLRFPNLRIIRPEELLAEIRPPKQD
jgi:putative PIN family toxin of toxin-antitoxin system